MRAFLPIGAVVLGLWAGYRSNAPTPAQERKSTPNDSSTHESSGPENKPASNGGTRRAITQQRVHSRATLSSVVLPNLNPDADPQRAWLLAEGPFHPAHDGRRLVTFTFDDGPQPQTTDAILRVLNHFDVRATFFVIGKYLLDESKRAERVRLLAKKVADRGHFLGNHTYRHELFSNLTERETLAEIDDTSRAIEQTTGQRVQFFRPPFGDLGRFGKDALAARKLELVMWSVDAEDMVERDGMALARRIIGQLNARAGGIVLLHDVHPGTVKALREVLKWLKSHPYDAERPSETGYDVVDLPTYLEATARSPQPYANRDELRKARAESLPKAESVNEEIEPPTIERTTARTR